MRGLLALGNLDVQRTLPLGSGFATGQRRGYEYLFKAEAGLLVGFLGGRGRLRLVGRGIFDRHKS